MVDQRRRRRTTTMCNHCRNIVALVAFLFSATTTSTLAFSSISSSLQRSTSFRRISSNSYYMAKSFVPWKTTDTRLKSSITEEAENTIVTTIEEPSSLEQPSTFEAVSPPRSLYVSDAQSFAAIWAGLTGWSDIALFTTYGAFPSMMTGNLMWAIKSIIVEVKPLKALFSLSLIVSYLLGAKLSSRLDLNNMYKSNRKRTRRGTLLIVPAVFALSNLWTTLTQQRWVPMLLLSCTFGLINKLGLVHGQGLTHVMTGHMTKVTENKDWATVWPSLTTLLGFAGGVFIAGLWRHIASISTLLPGVGQILQTVVTHELTLVGSLYGVTLLTHRRKQRFNDKQKNQQ